MDLLVAQSQWWWRVHAHTHGHTRAQSHLVAVVCRNDRMLTLTLWLPAAITWMLGCCGCTDKTYKPALWLSEYGNWFNGSWEAELPVVMEESRSVPDIRGGFFKLDLLIAINSSSSLLCVFIIIIIIIYKTKFRLGCLNSAQKVKPELLPQSEATGSTDALCLWWFKVIFSCLPQRRDGLGGMFECQLHPQCYPAECGADPVRGFFTCNWLSVWTSERDYSRGNLPQFLGFTWRYVVKKQQQQQKNSSLFSRCKMR